MTAMSPPVPPKKYHDYYHPTHTVMACPCCQKEIALIHNQELMAAPIYENIPLQVFVAAQTLNNWAAENGLNHWSILNVCSMSSLLSAQERIRNLEKKLDDLYHHLATKIQPPVLLRTTNNSIDTLPQ